MAPTAPRRALGSTGLEVFPLCLGANVMGWTATEAESFAVLDAYVAAGGNFVDTADVYSAWAPGNEGGESERVIGAWLRSRRCRDDVVVATKVGTHPRRPGLGARNIRRCLDDSLARLGTDYVDVYFAHFDDADTPIEETLGAFDGLVREGKVRAVGASNYDAARLQHALDVSAREGLVRYAVVQPHFNLVERSGWEGPLADVCLGAGLACVPYYGLARGFLTGKYQQDGSGETRRGDLGGADLAHEPHARAGLAALLDVSSRVGAPPAAAALAWSLSRPGIAAAIASARTVEQLGDLLPAVELTLAEDDLELLDATGSGA